MSLKTSLPYVLKDIRDNSKYFEHNETLFDIYEGELLPYVEKALRSQLSPQSFANMKHRLAPINILKKIIDKLSAIYQQPVTRRVLDGTDTDAQLLSWYEESFKINQVMNIGNEFFNLFKSTLIQPYLDKMNVPKLRAIPSHQFWVFSDDRIEPTKPTGVVVFMGEDKHGKIYHAYTDDEMLIVDDKGEPKAQMMNEYCLDGSNKIGKIPFVYVNRSMNLLHPKNDADILKLTLLASILVSDMNYISMFSAFSVLVGFNVKDEGLKFSPNALWTISQVDPDLKPEIQTLKNEGDIAALIEMIKFELQLWMSSKGLKASSLSGDDQSISGIAKMIDNIDTTDERKKQVEFFVNCEKELWDLTMHYLHPVWRKQPGFQNNAVFAPRASVEVVFSEQVPLLQRGEVVDNLSKEMEAGFLSKRSAMKKLNPHWSDDEIDAELKMIELESSFLLPDDFADQE